MERQSGVMLNDVWDHMEGSKKAEILKQVVGIESALASIKFTKFGALYYKHDLPQPDSTTPTPLYIDGNGKAVHSAEFEIGPTNHRSFFDFGRGVLDINRGPCMFPSNILNICDINYSTRAHTRGVRCRGSA